MNRVNLSSTTNLIKTLLRTNHVYLILTHFHVHPFLGILFELPVRLSEKQRVKKNGKR